MAKHNQSLQQQSKGKDGFTKITIEKWQSTINLFNNKTEDRFTKITIQNGKTQSIFPTTKQK
jgi:hypothetical protein